MTERICLFCVLPFHLRADSPFLYVLSTAIDQCSSEADLQVSHSTLITSDSSTHSLSHTLHAHLK